MRQHSTVALSRESADELFGGYWLSTIPRTFSATRFPGSKTATISYGGR
ncbi:asparagine synthase-related protein [Mesorhizobium sp. M0184]